ncbi:uncharacterized protein [Drosophila pseudoobscura]|uniref:DUF4729 domain-containing protein n=1 Tax=Drosophila pseudoobscura pseudoobscura TaxID=46245 RepID=A0A6I8W978_DROPS|nr:uncharacterized protein LOC6901665 [Drosophila pseudoobscura]
MYECEHCGCRKTTLNGAPTYELRRTATGSELVGERRWIFDTCSICRNVRFFRQLEEDEDEDEASLEEPHKSDAAEEPEGLSGAETEDEQIAKAETEPEPEPGDGFGDGQDQVVPVMQRVKMLEGKAKEANPKPTKGQLGGKQPEPDPEPEPETDAESSVVSSSETVIESFAFAFTRATSGWASGMPSTPRTSFKVPLKRYSLQPGLKCKRKAMRRLASIRLDVDHQLKKTELELRDLEVKRVQVLSEGDGPSLDCRKGIAPLLDSVVEFLLEQSLYKDKASQTEHEAGAGRRLSTVEQLRQLVETVSTVKRCSYQAIGHTARQAYRGMKHTDRTTKPRQAEDQFHTVSFTDKELLGALASKAHLFEDTAPKQPLYPKEPMPCPDLHCPKTCFPSELHEHLLSDHPGLKARPVGLRQSETLYMDPKALPLNEATCLQLYEVKDKIAHAQPGWRGDLLPVLVMAARARFSNDSDSADDPNSGDEADALLVWLSSFRQADLRLYGTLSVWSPRPHMADTLTVLTGQPHDICAPKDLATMLRTPCTVVVPHAQLQRMTARNGGPEPSLIAVQVQFQ